MNSMRVIGKLQIVKITYLCSHCNIIWTDEGGKQVTKCRTCGKSGMWCNK